MVSIREIAGCVGFSGNISVMRSFYGYPRVPLPSFRGVSLLKQTTLLKSNPHIILHIKMVNPLWTDPLSKPRFNSIIQYIDAMRLLYESVGIGVIIKSYEVLGGLPQFQNIRVGVCATTYTHSWLGDSTSYNITDEQRALYSNNNFVEFLTRPSPDGGDEQYTIEIVAYFVDTSTPPLGGCATPSAGSAIVTINSGVYTLAHEVGHILGLSHVTDTTRLMNPSPAYTKTPPDLVPSEVATMKKFDYMHAHC